MGLSIVMPNFNLKREISYDATILHNHQNPPTNYTRLLQVLNDDMYVLQGTQETAPPQVDESAKNDSPDIEETSKEKVEEKKQTGPVITKCTDIVKMNQ